MEILKINFKPKNEREFSDKSLERFVEFAKHVFIKENIHDSGNFSEIFLSSDIDSNICFKKIKPFSKPTNDAWEETDFLDRVYSLSKNSGVMVPKPIFALKALVKYNKESRPIERQVIGMSFMDAYKMEDVIESKNNARIPDNFNVDEYFGSLRNFIKKIHENGIYHADLFSRNIMIDKKTNAPVLIDFGEARGESLDEKRDAYGRLKIENFYGEEVLEDLDLKNLSVIEEDIRRMLTKV
jgi:serine/threonine protein kinase